MPGHMDVGAGVTIGFNADGEPYAEIKDGDELTPRTYSLTVANMQVHEYYRQLNQERAFIRLWWERCEQLIAERNRKREDQDRS